VPIAAWTGPQCQVLWPLIMMWGGATYAVLTDESLSIGCKTDERTGVLGQSIEGARSGDGWIRWGDGRQMAGRRQADGLVVHMWQLVLTPVWAILVVRSRWSAKRLA
jgi:hypothetical protein